MRNKIIPFLLLILSFSLTSCFDVIEDVTIHENGSGSFKFIGNLSQSASRINTILSLDSLNGQPVPSKAEIGAHIDRFRDRMAQQAGISNVVVNKDFDKYILTISFDFKDMNSLNQALHNVSESYNKKRYTLPKTLYSYDGNSLERKELFHSFLSTLIAKGQKDQLNTNLGGASYTSVFRLDKKVTKVSNTKATLAKDNTIVILRTPIADVLTKKTLLSNTIYF